MTISTKSVCSDVPGPQGYPLRLENLPPPTIKRWVPHTKADIVMAVGSGLISALEACKRYGLTPEELLSWTTAYAQHGMDGLRATRRSSPSLPA